MRPEIEKLARVLAKLDWPEVDWETYSFSETGAEQYRVRAVAVLEALLEPSEAMVEAGGETLGMKAVDAIVTMHQARGYGVGEGFVVDGKYPLAQAFTAMIGKALGR